MSQMFLISKFHKTELITDELLGRQKKKTFQNICCFIVLKSHLELNY